MSPRCIARGAIATTLLLSLAAMPLAVEAAPSVDRVRRAERLALRLLDCMKMRGIKSVGIGVARSGARTRVAFDVYGGRAP